MVKTALLIGVSEYAAGLNPLPKAVDDIAAMKDVLETPALGGFTEVKVLPNPKPFEMQFEIEQLFAGRKKDDLIVLFFSGHGVKDDSGNLYFATSLTKKTPDGELIKSTAVPSRFIHDIMSNSRSRRQVVILDCCFSGAFAKGLSAKDDGSVPVKEQLGGEGRVVLTSSTATQYSFEESGEDLSVYTRYLVEGITSGAADIDNDGMIGVEELHEYAKRKVHESSPAMKPKIYAVEEGFKILLTQSPVHDPKLVYRKEVEERTSQGKISTVGRKILDALKAELALSDEVTAEIEAAAVKPHEEYQAKLSTYQQVLKETLAKESPLSAYARDELRRYQRVLGLRDQDVAPIKTQILGSPRPQSAPPNQEPLQNEPTNSAPIKNQFFSQPPSQVHSDTSPPGSAINNAPVPAPPPLDTSGITPLNEAVMPPVSERVNRTAEAPQAVAPNSLLSSTPPTPSSRQKQSSLKLPWLLAGVVGIAFAVGGGLSLMNSNRGVDILQDDGVQSEIIEEAPSEADPKYIPPDEEIELRTRVSALREELGINIGGTIVDPLFRKRHPQLGNRQLQQIREDEDLRMKWFESEEAWLNFLDDNLSRKAISGLGSHESKDFAQQSKEAATKGVTLNEVTDEKFLAMFSGRSDLVEDAEKFSETKVGKQIWYGVALDEWERVMQDNNAPAEEEKPVDSETPDGEDSSSEDSGNNEDSSNADTPVDPTKQEIPATKDITENEASPADPDNAP